jgi:hypothetical protein
MHDHANEHQTRTLLTTLEDFLLLAEPETILDLQAHLERQGSNLSAHELVEALSRTVTQWEQSDD